MKNLTDFRKTVETGVDPGLQTAREEKNQNKIKQKNIEKQINKTRTHTLKISPIWLCPSYIFFVSALKVRRQRDTWTLALSGRRDMA